MHLLYDSAILLLGFYPKESICPYNDLYKICMATLFIIETENSLNVHPQVNE